MAFRHLQWLCSEADGQESLINAVPENVISALQVVGGIMPALGIAMLLNYLGKKTLIPWFFGGFFLTVYSGLGLTAVSPSSRQSLH
ncbi:MAG: PTS sugar transporter subunit IIC [Dorea sp.]